MHGSRYVLIYQSGSKGAHISPGVGRIHRLNLFSLSHQHRKLKATRLEITPDDNVSTGDTMPLIKAYEILKEYTVGLLYY